VDFSRNNKCKQQRVLQSSMAGAVLAEAGCREEQRSAQCPSWLPVFLINPCAPAGLF